MFSHYNINLYVSLFNWYNYTKKKIGTILATSATFDKNKIVHLGGTVEQKREETLVKKLSCLCTRKRIFYLR